jgi:hypothetical protein
MELRNVRHAALVGIAAMMSMAAAPSQIANVAVKMDQDCRVRTFVPSATGAAKLDAGNGVLALVGTWQPVRLSIKGHRQIDSAYVYNYALKNNWGAPTSKREASTPSATLFEVTVVVELPKGARAVDTSSLEFTIPGSSPATALGFDTIRSAEVSDDFVVLDNGLCLTENDGGLAAQYLGILNATASRSTIVYLSGEATRPLPIRILVSVPAGAKAISVSQRRE